MRCTSPRSRGSTRWRSARTSTAPRCPELGDARPARPARRAARRRLRGGRGRARPRQLARWRRRGRGRHCGRRGWAQAMAAQGPRSRPGTGERPALLPQEDGGWGRSRPGARRRRERRSVYPRRPPIQACTPRAEHERRNVAYAHGARAALSGLRGSTPASGRALPDVLRRSSRRARRRGPGGARRARPCADPEDAAMTDRRSGAQPARRREPRLPPPRAGAPRGRARGPRSRGRRGRSRRARRAPPAAASRPREQLQVVRRERVAPSS